ncbi:unnamed protein product [Staurois parvus]|uniref:Uncharacterized protein n=1 Tax=Staurois parvus TaxID=386267 RepID=A0ABN9H7J0_9NEOB|nr:unnamed protein product [Staurois parvus]
MQSGKYHSPGNHQTQTHPSDCQTEKRDSSLQRIHLHSSRVQWRLAELLLFPVASTLLHYHYQLTVEYLAKRKFHRWTYCTGGNLSRYHA